MKTNVNALKDLFVKFGGSLSTVYEDISPVPVGEYVSISAMIEACSKVAGGGSDNLFIVTADLAPETMALTNVSATPAEICAANAEGKNVIFVARNIPDETESQVAISLMLNNYFFVPDFAEIAVFGGAVYDMGASVTKYASCTVTQEGEQVSATLTTYTLTA